MPRRRRCRSRSTRAYRLPGSIWRRSFRGMLDWTQCLAVERVPGKVSGAWVFQGTRVPVQAVHDLTPEAIQLVAAALK